MGLFDIFAPKAPEQAATNNQTAAPSPGDKAIADGKIPGTDAQPVNPMEAYAKLFDNATTDTSKPPAFSIDPAVLDKVSGGLNFTQGVNPELMQKATSGDVGALIEIMNQVGQQAYKASLNHSTTLTDKFVGARSEFDFKNIGSKVKQELTSSALQTSVPNANDPIVKQELRRIATAMQAQNPDASPQEIADSAKQYFTALYNSMQPKKTQEEQQVASGERDWDKYFD